MRKLLTIIVFAISTCFYLNAKAQVDESRNFVYFSSDSVLYARNVRLRLDFFNSLQLRADSKRIPLRQVKFINSDEGFFANTRRSDILGQTGLSERIIAGDINLYQERPYSSFSFNRLYNDRSGVNTKMFYNKGYQNLKKVNYSNLKVDMADHAESIDLLENYRRNINTSRILYVGAGASVVAALVSFLITAENDKVDRGPSGGVPFPGNSGVPFPTYKNDPPSFTLSFGLLGLGAGLALGGYFTHVSALRKLEGAIDTYNR